MKISFFDIGSYHGKEIDLFINEITGLYPYSVNAFEAHPEYAKKLSLKYKKDPNVNIHSIAIGDCMNETGFTKLFLAPNEEGNSIYSSKNNVTQDYVNVPIEKFSKIIKKLNINLDDSYNIVRFNIEGAELDLIQDLILNNLHKKINLFLGAKAGEDILKVKEISHKYKGYMELLKREDITIHPYCYVYGRKNISIKSTINSQ